jgi:hypothetical protein
MRLIRTLHLNLFVPVILGLTFEIFPGLLEAQEADQLTSMTVEGALMAKNWSDPMVNLAGRPEDALQPIPMSMFSRHFRFILTSIITEHFRVWESPTICLPRNSKSAYRSELSLPLR